MAKPKKGVVPPQLRPYLFRAQGGGRAGSRRSGKQSLGSWLTSGIALAIGFSNVIVRATEASKVGPGDKWKYFMGAMMQDYIGFEPSNNSFDARRMIRGYAPIVAGYAFKKGTSMLLKTAKLKTLIPRLG